MTTSFEVVILNEWYNNYWIRLFRCSGVSSQCRLLQRLGSQGRCSKSMGTRRGSMRNGVMEIEQGTFTPLVFTTTEGMADECVKYHSRLAELIANKKGESYSSAISWIRAKVSFAIVRSAILCLRGSRSRRRQLDFVGSDLQIENIRPARIKKFFF